MKTYSVSVKWNHLGSRYPVSQYCRVKASSAAVAANRALALTQKNNSASYREAEGSSIRVDIYINGAVGKEADDGRGIRDEQSQEP